MFFICVLLRVSADCTEIDPAAVSEACNEQALAGAAHSDARTRAGAALQAATLLPDFSGGNP
jgi:hypothetical protein